MPAQNTAVLGAQWGDEGKGKIINHLARSHDWVVRFSGGPNAGHTIYFEGRKLVHHVLPSLHVGSAARGWLGSAMVLDLEKLVAELARFEEPFPGFGRRFTIDRDAFLILPWHRAEDEHLEGLRRTAIGTTRRGIGPAYADKVARRGVRIGDVHSPRLLPALEELHATKRGLYPTLELAPAREVADALRRQLDSLLASGMTLSTTVESARDFEGASILYEGAQGIMLDIEFGTYPYVTSALCGLAAIHACGFARWMPARVLGVIKAYCTRVGEGPFPSEVHGDEGDAIRRAGGEFGATTGRPRRIGWLDLPALRYAAQKGGITHWVMTKQDILDGRPTVPVCTAHEVDGRELHTPANADQLARARPVWRELPGWAGHADPRFRDYARFVERETGVPLLLVSHGPATEDITDWK